MPRQSQNFSDKTSVSYTHLDVYKRQLSGGEPMLQGEASVEILNKCKQNGLNPAVATCGFFNKKYLRELASSADLLLWDIKDTNKERHINNTGVSLTPILDNLFEADKLGIKLRLRCILINGINTDEYHFDAVCKIAEQIKNLQGIDLIPYHPMGKSKYKHLGIDDSFNNKSYIPHNEITELFRMKIKTV